MFKQPVTYCMNFAHCDEVMRNYVMQEFAANGAKHMVLTDQFILNIMKDYKLAAQLCRELESFGMSFADAHSPFGGVLDMNCPDETFRPQMLMRHKMALRIAADCGVKTITIHPGSDRFFPEVPLEKHIDLMCDALDELLPEAEKCDVIICIENSMSRAACPKQVVAIKEKYPTDFLGLCYDSGHAYQLEKGWQKPGGVIWKFWQTVGVAEPEWDEKSVERMLPHMVNCHLHDNDSSADSHLLPGKGEICWEKLIPMLKTAPRLQVIQSEVRMLPEVSIAAVCRKFAELGEM